MPAPLRTTAMLAAVLLSGCGSRTDLLLSDENAADADGGGAPIQDASTPPEAAVVAPPSDGVLCSLYEGPVDSCDAGASAGPVQRCDNGLFTQCIQVFEPGGNVPYGQWGCCLAKPPENVPQCLDRQFFDAGCM
jgi:hypothetical protein